MGRRGPDRKVTPEQIIDLLTSARRPVWSSGDLAEYADVTRQTAHARLKEVEETYENVHSVKVGSARAYYYDEGPTPDDSTEDYHRRSLKTWLDGRFVGLQTAPWTAVHPNDGPAKAGDKVQIHVAGTPGNWRRDAAHHWENRREELIADELVADETQALISGTLYSKATTPIEHTNYPDDYDLELNIGAKEIETDKGTATLAAGVKHYLIRPCNDAVFLTDVEVDWISPKGEGEEIETFGFSEDVMREVEDWQDALEGGEE